jgi:hypothetical protein
MINNNPFDRLLSEIKELHDKKAHDYGGADRFRNLRMCERAGIPAWQGVYVRMTDKLARIENFIQQETLKVEDETIRDTFIDLAVYSLLGLLLWEETNEEKQR